jgi:hypothetical protein
MATVILTTVLIVSMLALLILTGRSPYASEKLRESFFRNQGVAFRNLIALSLGFTAAFLPLAGGTWTLWPVSWVFVGLLVLTMFLLIAVRPTVEGDVDRFAWGMLVFVILGFGLGALIYLSRSWWIWLWRKYRLIDQPHELLLEALFLIGVILGVFVVRNWGKEQKAFLESLSGVLGGTFVATVLGEVQDGLTPLRALAYYALGFTLSAAINLILAARLTANYTNKRSISSRALLDYLYGSERAKTIDGYFLKNFEDDKDYAKASMTAVLVEYRNLVKREFAERMEQRRREREKQRNAFKTRELIRLGVMKEGESIEHLEVRLKALEPACSQVKRAREKLERLEPEHEERRAELKQTIKLQEEDCDRRQFEEWEGLVSKLERARGIIEKMRREREKLEPACSELEARMNELTEVLAETESLRSIPEPRPPKLQAKLEDLEDKYEKLEKKIQHLNAKCPKEQLKKWRELDHRLNSLKPSYYYELIAIECEEAPEGAAKTTAEIQDKDREYSVVYRFIDSELGMKIDDTMFRAGVTVKWQDVLEYVSASGGYRKPFPYFGSVAGLALLFRQTVIMDRDANKKFRSDAYPQGTCPADIEQSRGLDEIDYLSYISLPVISRPGTTSENGVGLVTIDSKLFVTPYPLDGEPVKASESIFRTRLSPQHLTEFANNLFDQNDAHVKHLEQLTKIIVPVVELYSKCRVGAI